MAPSLLSFANLLMRIVRAQLTLSVTRTAVRVVCYCSCLLLLALQSSVSMLMLFYTWSGLEGILNVMFWQVNTARPVWLDTPSLREGLDLQPPLRERIRKGSVCLSSV